ncbi:MAG TPA: LysM peptidoglycan-binding domain-containing protein [Thermoanaerobaculia bacterium]|jgi:nucleoid-associated protein YgaU|nr:LysM peptidoglycan-binding domain-containing protein [Thermoanaerobaculia bacterium]
MPIRPGSFALVLWGLLTAAAGVRAAAPASPMPAAPPPGMVTGWHIVRPGETLEKITARYLGSSDLWRQLAQINPEIADPNKLEPGQRVRIYLQRKDTAVARVAQLSRKVEAQASPIPWGDAHLNDLLVERDGVRTYPKSSASMAFTDGTLLLVTEDSLVFLQRTGGALRGVERKSVEIVQGQADVEARPAAGHAAPPAAEVEIVLGSARATARTDRTGAVQTRARRAEGGGAKLMAYGGDADLEAGGAKVQVPQGMGSSVAASGPPAPPEKLLAAPHATAPADGAEVACANPSFSWEEVPTASSYIVEICRDPGCAALVERATGLNGTTWRPQALPAAALYWRVTARSRSGLDGYPGATSKLAVTSTVADTQPPAGTLTLTGPQVSIGDTLFAGPGARLEVVATDAESGVAEWLPVINGREGRLSEAAGPWAAGVYVLGATAVDRCGNRGPVAPITFTVDATPPTLSWELMPYDSFGGRGVRQRGKVRSAPVTWSGGVQWLPLGDGEEVRINSDGPQAFFHAPGAHFMADGREVTLGEGQMLRIRATDDQSHVEHLRFVLRRGEGGKSVLEVESGDLVGNSRKVNWELRPADQK